MDPLYIKASEDTPKVLFDPLREIFEISGRSLPEDVNHFFKPVVKWLEDYFKVPNEKTVLVLNLNYFNTASSKILDEIFSYLDDKVSDGFDVEIKWYCGEDDEDIMEAGYEFSENVDLPFEVVIMPE